MSEFFKDKSGRLSSMRLAFIAVVAIVLVVWVVAFFTGMTIPDIPAGVYAVLGLLSAAKMGQSYAEKPKETA